MNHLISIIIPVLNRQNEIEECIRSVFTQSYENWELLLIDNGSTDRTLEICQALAAEEPRIRLLRAPRGVSLARNAGVDAARGKYLFFLDSDDVIHPSLLETLLHAMEKHQAGLAGTPVINIHQSQWGDFAKRPKTHKGIGKYRFLTNEQALQAIFQYATPINLIGGVMMLRSLVADTRFRSDLHIGEDFYFMYENLIKGTDVVFVESKWYFARIHNSNLSWDYSFRGFLSRFQRRKLVWLSEEAFGRTENVKLQKLDALDVYLRCLRHHRTINEDTVKMQRVMKDHRKVLLSGLALKHRLLYALAVYAPRLYFRIYKPDT